MVANYALRRFLRNLGNDPDCAPASERVKIGFEHVVCEGDRSIPGSVYTNRKVAFTAVGGLAVTDKD